MNTDEQRQDFLEKTARQIGEHFDHVLVLVTVDDEEDSCFYYAGAGNCFARRGMVEYYRRVERAEDRAAEED